MVCAAWRSSFDACVCFVVAAFNLMKLQVRLAHASVALCWLRMRYTPCACT